MQTIRDCGADILCSHLQDQEGIDGSRFAPAPGWTKAPETTIRAVYSA